MKVIIFGATGMVGSGVLKECLDDPRVLSARVVGRSRCGITHPKLRETIHSDFSDDSRAWIPVIVEIIPLEPAGSARLRFKFIEPAGDTIRSEETHQLNREERIYTVNGKSFTVTEISGLTTPKSGELVWGGTEVENGQEVQFRQIIRLRVDTLTVEKETRTPLEFRNGLRLQRKP